MVAFIEGTVAGLSESAVEIDVGGIGFEVLVSAQTLSRLSGTGRERSVKLYTYLYVREDAMLLYGFLSKDELVLFKRLITVSGIGPKGGLSLLSALSADELRFAILTGDVKSISRAPGIGKRTAERLIIDLRGKLEMDAAGSIAASAAGFAQQGEAEAPEEGGASAAREAADALTALGYARMEALKAVQQAAASMEDGESADTETLLKAALRYMM